LGVDLGVGLTALGVSVRRKFADWFENLPMWFPQNCANALKHADFDKKAFKLSLC
jgi:hypothetical protein